MKNGPRLVTEGLATTQPRFKEQYVMTRDNPTHPQTPAGETPALCPICGTPATSRGVHTLPSGVTVGNYMCGMHIWTTKWLAGGAA